MMTSRVILRFLPVIGLMLLSSCSSATPSLEPTTSPIGAERLTVKEAFDMAYQRASAEYDDLHLLTIGAGGTVVGFKEGEPPIGEGRSENWLVTFAKKRTETTYDIVIVNIRGGVITNFYEGGGTLEVREASWQDFARKNLVDISKWNVDSPEAVEIAKKSDGEGLEPLFFALEGFTTIADYPIYQIGLGPVTGKGGTGLNVFMDPTDGTVLSTGETTWR